MKAFTFQKIAAVVALSGVLICPAIAFEGQQGNVRPDTLKSLEINRSMLARFESEYSSLSVSRSSASSGLTQRELTNIRYKIQALSEDGDRLIQSLPETLQANEFLRNVGMKSVQEAGPFPPFPKDLNYPELTFNVQISFQYREGE